MIVWIWDASGPAVGACGVAGTAEAARSAAGSVLAAGRAETARVERAVLVISTGPLTYDYWPDGHTWTARLNAGRAAWTHTFRSPEQVA